MALQVLGSRLVLEDADSYISGLTNAGQVTDDFVSRLNQLSGKKVDFDASGLANYESSLAGSIEKTGVFGTSLSALQVVGIGALEAVGHAAVDLTLQLGELAAKSVINFGLKGFEGAETAQQTLADIAAQSGATNDQMDALNAKLREISLRPDLKVGFDEAGDAVSQLLNLGIKLPTILGGGLEQVVLLQNSIGGSFAQNGELFAKAVKQFNIPPEQFATLTNSLTALRRTGLDVNDINNLLSQGGGAAGAITDFNDFFKAAALARSGFGSGADLGTSFKTLESRIANPPKELKAALKEYGLNFFDAATGAFVGFENVQEQVSRVLTQPITTQQVSGGRTDAQQKEFERLNKQLASKQQELLNINNGTKLFSSDEARNKRIHVLEEEIKNTQGLLGPLQAIQGQVSTVSRTLTEKEKLNLANALGGQDALRLILQLGAATDQQVADLNNLFETTSAAEAAATRTATFQAKLETLQDVITQVGRDAATPLLAPLTPVLEDIITLVNAAAPGIQKLGESIATYIQPGVDFFHRLTEALVNLTGQEGLVLGFGRALAEAFQFKPATDLFKFLFPSQEEIASNLNGGVASFNTQLDTFFGSLQIGLQRGLDGVSLTKLTLGDFLAFDPNGVSFLKLGENVEATLKDGNISVRLGSFTFDLTAAKLAVQTEFASLQQAFSTGGITGLFTQLKADLSNGIASLSGALFGQTKPGVLPGSAPTFEPGLLTPFTEGLEKGVAALFPKLDLTAAKSNIASEFDSIKTAFEKNGFVGVGTLLITQFTSMLTDVGAAFADKFTQVKNFLFGSTAKTQGKDEAATSEPGILSGFVPDFVTAGVQEISALFETVRTTFVSLSALDTGTLTGNFALAINTVLDLFTKLSGISAGGLTEGLTGVASFADTFVAGFINSITSVLKTANVPEIVVAATEFVSSLIGSLSTALTLPLNEDTGAGGFGSQTTSGSKAVSAVGNLLTTLFNEIEKTLVDPRFGESLGRAGGSFGNLLVHDLLAPITDALDPKTASQNAQNQQAFADNPFKKLADNFIAGFAESFNTADFSKVGNVFVEKLTQGIVSILAKFDPTRIFGGGITGLLQNDQQARKDLTEGTTSLFTDPFATWKKVFGFGPAENTSQAEAPTTTLTQAATTYSKTTTIAGTANTDFATKVNNASTAVGNFESVLNELANAPLGGQTPPLNASNFNANNLVQAPVGNAPVPTTPTPLLTQTPTQPLVFASLVNSAPVNAPTVASAPLVLQQPNTGVQPLQPNAPLQTFTANLGDTTVLEANTNALKALTDTLVAPVQTSVTPVGTSALTSQSITPAAESGNFVTALVQTAQPLTELANKTGTVTTASETLRLTLNAFATSLTNAKSKLEDFASVVNGLLDPMEVFSEIILRIIGQGTGTTPPVQSSSFVSGASLTPTSTAATSTGVTGSQQVTNGVTPAFNVSLLSPVTSANANTPTTEANPTVTPGITFAQLVANLTAALEEVTIEVNADMSNFVITQPDWQKLITLQPDWKAILKVLPDWNDILSTKPDWKEIFTIQPNWNSIINRQPEWVNIIDGAIPWTEIITPVDLATFLTNLEDTTSVLPGTTQVIPKKQRSLTTAESAAISKAAESANTNRAATVSVLGSLLSQPPQTFTTNNTVYEQTTYVQTARTYNVSYTTRQSTESFARDLRILETLSS